MTIAKCSRNVPFVLERLCDVDEAVRRAAFLYISAINVTQLRVRQRLLTLKVNRNKLLTAIAGTGFVKVINGCILKFTLSIYKDIPLTESLPSGEPEASLIPYSGW